MDCCPHRLVPLSEGRITATGQLQCGYHGWNFNSSGKCTAIPQGGNMNNPRTCAKVYQCAVSQGELQTPTCHALQCAIPGFDAAHQACCQISLFSCCGCLHQALNCNMCAQFPALLMPFPFSSLLTSRLCCLQVFSG